MEKRRGFGYRILVLAGVVSTGVGLVGIVVPLLPTTGFLLIGAACFLRSSPRLYSWITSNRVMGPMILSYSRFRAISARSRVVSLVLLWIAIVSSSYFSVDSWWVRLLLLGIAVGVTIHLVTLKTLSPEMRREIEEDMANIRAGFDSKQEP